MKGSSAKNGMKLSHSFLLFACVVLAIATGACARAQAPANTNNNSSANAEATQSNDRQRSRAALRNRPAGPPKTTTGGIEVHSNPPGARVLLIPDDEGGAGEPQPKGLTPTTITDISPGKYTVHLEKSGYKFSQRTVVIKANSTTKISASLKRR